MINTRMLQAYMILKGVTTKSLADAQGWSMSTAYRIINGKTAFTAPEIQLCIKQLSLNSSIANEIFFAANLS